MTISTAQLDEWAKAYINAQQLPENELTHHHPLWWSVERFMRLEDREAAEDSWLAILEVLQRTQVDEVLGVLAAGPLEDLISHWGTSFIERIEAEAIGSPRFRDLLKGVWESGDPDVCDRVVALKAQLGR